MTDKPLDQFPFLEIHDWNDHQPPEADKDARFIRCYPRLLHLAKFKSLTLAERGLLLSLWLYRGGTGLNPERVPSEAAVSLGVARTKHLVSHLKTLERRGFVKPTKKRAPYKRRGEERRGDKKGVGGLKPPPPPPAVFVLQATANETYPIAQDQLDRWSAEFPGVDIRHEIAKAAGWMDDNPTRRKTKRGMANFLRNWFGRTQDRPRNTPQQNHGQEIAKPPETAIQAEIARARAARAK